MEKEDEKKPRSRLRWLLKAVLALAILLVVFVLSIPFLLTHIPIPTLEFDLEPVLGEKTAALFERKKVTVDLDIRRGKPDGFRIRADGHLLDWSYHATANARFGFIRAKGDFSLTLDGTNWRLDADFDARGTKDWRFHASIPETPFTQEDAVLEPVLAKLNLSAVSNLVFAGAFSLEADGSSTTKRPVPAWTARGSVKGVDASLETGGKSVRIDNLRLRFGLDGLADHRDIAPLAPRADCVEFSGFTLSNVFANVRATEKSYLVTEAGANCCGGELKLYSLFLDPKSLTAGATIFVDGVDAGKVLAHVSAFRGDATGRLHGKLPFFLKGGKTLTLRNAYLFSTPGETGKVRIADASPILDNLALAGLPASERDNLANALADLDYTVLKIEFKRGEGEVDPSLPLKIVGTATRGKTTVPVNINVTFHGVIDQLINTGMKLSRRSR